MKQNGFWENPGKVCELERTEELNNDQRSESINTVLKINSTLDQAGAHFLNLTPKGASVGRQDHLRGDVTFNWCEDINSRWRWKTLISALTVALTSCLNGSETSGPSHVTSRHFLLYHLSFSFFSSFHHRCTLSLVSRWCLSLFLRQKSNKLSILGWWLTCKWDREQRMEERVRRELIGGTFLKTLLGGTRNMSDYFLIYKSICLEFYQFIQR